MVEMLRNRDNSGTRFELSARMMSAVVALMMSSVLPAWPQRDMSERQLEAAIHREMVVGDLQGAIEQYNTIIGQSPKARAVASRALLRMGECLEKLGQRKEARATYGRVMSEYVDQADVTAEVRHKLAGWTDAAPGPRNLGFEEGEPGRVPLGWFVPAVESRTARLAELRRDGCRSRGGCAVVQAPTNASKPVGNLMQSFSALSYRGKTIRLRAWLRIEAADPQDRAQMWLRVDRINGQVGFFDNMEDRPVRTPVWTSCEITTEVDEDAQFLDFGASSIGKGRVWVDDVSFEVVPKAEVDSARGVIQDLYASIDTAITQGNLEDTLSVTVPDAVYRAYGKSAPFRESLTRYSTIQTAVISFRLSGTGALATARSEFSVPGPDGPVSGVNTFRDLWGRVGESWKLKRRILLTGRFNAPPTDPLIAKLVAADLKQLAAPLATPEAGHMFYDLAPFGHAIGDTRIVALGEATSGTREFFQMKHRLLEYLVKEKGFTVLAITGNRSECTAIDRYIKSGEGDPKTALSRINSWLWNTQEALDIIEWMRVYNQAPAAGRAVSFASADLNAPVVDPGEKTVLWANNLDVAFSKLNKRAYVVGFSFHRGELRAVGVRNGEPGGLANHRVASLPGTGDWVFSSAGMPLFFLDFRSVPPRRTLGLWLAESHLYRSLRGDWNVDDPESHLQPQILSKAYDGLIFVEDGHAAKGLEATHAQ